MQSIRSKLLAGLGLIILFFLAQAVIVWFGQEAAKRNVVDATRKNTLASSQLAELAVRAQQVRRYEKEYFVYVSNEEKRNGYIKEWTGTADKIKQDLQVMRKNADGAYTQEDLGQIGNWTSATEFYTSEMAKIFDAVNTRQSKISSVAQPVVVTAPIAATGQKGAAAPVPPAEPPVVMFAPTEVNAMIGPGKDRLSGVLIKGVSEMSAAKTKDTLALVDVANASFKRLLLSVLATVGLGLAIALALMSQLPKAVSKPIQMLTKAVDEMTKGNLEQKVAAGVKEFDGLAKALDRMRVSQQALVQRLRSR
jgi:hypothetical protein